MAQQWEPAGSKSTWDDLVEDIIGRDTALVQAHLTELLVWLQDLNWPGAPCVADFLAGVGRPVIPHARAILQGSDREWQYWVLIRLIDRWPQELVAEVEPELMTLAHLEIHDEVEIMALAQLMKHHMVDPSMARRLVDHKRLVYQSTPSLLDWLEPTNPSQ